MNNNIKYNIKDCTLTRQNHLRIELDQKPPPNQSSKQAPFRANYVCFIKTKQKTEKVNDTKIKSPAESMMASTT